MDPLIQILMRLSDHGVESVLVGGMAAVVHGAAVTTKDVDVCAPLDLPNLERIVALRGLNPRFRFRPDLLRLYDDPTRLVGFKNLNLVTDWGIIDIFGELTGVGTYADVAGRTIRTRIGNFECRMLDLDTLIVAKQSAGRDKDMPAVRDLQALKKYRDHNPGLFDDL